MAIVHWEKCMDDSMNLTFQVLYNNAFRGIVFLCYHPYVITLLFAILLSLCLVTFIASTSSSDGLVQKCTTLSQWLLYKTAAFYTEQCTSPSLFTTLKSHEAVQTSH